MLVATIGTRHQVVTRNRIVFIEDVNEPPYAVDRMLTHLLNAGLLADAAGIALGRFVPHRDYRKNEREHRECESHKASPMPARGIARDREPTMAEAIASALAGVRRPIVMGLPFGHVADIATLPLGIMASLDAARGELTLDEPAVAAAS